LVGMRTNGDFTQLFFLNENFARATTVMENHNGSWLYYPTTLAVGFFPWSIFMAPVILCVDQRLSQKHKDSGPITFLTCWVLVQVGLFSLAETKLPSYVTPCYPALAMLTAYCLTRWIPEIVTIGSRWKLAAFSTMILAGIITFVGLLAASNELFPKIWWISVLGLIPVVGGAIAVAYQWRGSATYANFSMVGTAFVFCIFMFGIGTVAVDSTRETETLLSEIQKTNGEGLATYHCLESSWVFYADQPIHELHQGQKLPSTPTSIARNEFWKRKPVVMPEDFVAAKPNASFITTDDRVAELLSRLPSDFRVKKEVNFFLKSDQKLVLIQRVGTASVAKSASNPTTIR
ncbi:MAG: hypothetical protein AAGA30_03490, partial [Planctomycetota bacterium]